MSYFMILSGCSDSQSYILKPRNSLQECKEYMAKLCKDEKLPEPLNVKKEELNNFQFLVYPIIKKHFDECKSIKCSLKQCSASYGIIIKINIEYKSIQFKYTIKEIMKEILRLFDKKTIIRCDKDKKSITKEEFDIAVKKSCHVKIELIL